MMDPKDISEFQHEEFYRYIAQAYDKPRFTLHYKTDAPLNIRSIFYVPEMVRCCTGHCVTLGKPKVMDNSQCLYPGVPSEELHRLASVYLPLWCRAVASSGSCYSRFPSAFISCSSNNSSARSILQKPSQGLFPCLASADPGSTSLYCSQKGLGWPLPSLTMSCNFG